MKTSEIKANRQKWYDELMNGKHSQTQNILQDDKGMCCLGVACYVAVSEGIIDESGTNEYGEVVYGGSSRDLPVEVQDWLGFDSSDPLTIETENGFKMTFSALNDSENMSFEKIAAILKRDFIDPLDEEGDKDVIGL